MPETASEATYRWSRDAYDRAVEAGVSFPRSPTEVSMSAAMGLRTSSWPRVAVWKLAAALRPLTPGVLLTALAFGGPAAGVAAAQDRAFEPVTDAVLADPDPADWLHWRRTLDGWGF